MYIDIKTERLVLRPLEVSDLHTAHAYASDAKHTRYMIHLPNRSVEDSGFAVC